MGDFGGWDMPIDYAGTGVVAEHTAVRESAAKFDVSHMGKLLVRGPGAAAHLNEVLTNDLRRISGGQAQYTMLCDEGGGVVDDMIAYLEAEDSVFLIPNAANAAEVRDALARAVPAGIDIEDLHEELSIVAVQGPRSADVLTGIGLDAAAVEYMSFQSVEWLGRPVRLARTGYTGELGFEVVVPAQAAQELWESLDAPPAGLGARDTLRTEMGYPLHGQDLGPSNGSSNGPSIGPVQARLGWAVGWEKESFAGSEALRAARERADSRLWGLLARGRGVLRPGLDVKAGGEVIGTTTSGTFSPTLKAGIALALLPAQAAPGDMVEVDVRGRLIPCEVVRPPFVPSRVR